MKLAKNYFTQKLLISDLENALRNARAELRLYDPYGFIAEMSSLTEVGGDRFFSDEGDVLAELIADRDFPLDEDEIREQFIAAGIKHFEHLVQKSRPDTKESLAEYIAERRRDEGYL
jgi:hypothetical protein